jgi:hypothetical protein
MTRLIEIACGLGFLGMLGCGAEVTVYDEADSHAVEHPERPASGPVDPWAFCPSAWVPAKPADAMSCAGAVPYGELQAEQAEQIFARTIHELDHIAELLGTGSSDAGGLFELDGNRLVGVNGGGWVDGVVAQDAEGERTCASLRMACWTGGHGGFGPSALDGMLQIQLEDEVVQAHGKVGLVEGGALIGAPAVAVEARIVDGAASGTVGSFEL